MAIWHTTYGNRCGVFSPWPTTASTINGQRYMSKGVSITVPNNLVLDTKAMGATVEAECLRVQRERFPEKKWQDELQEYLKANGRTLGLYPGLPGRPDVDVVSLEDAAKLEKAKTAGVKVHEGRSLSAMRRG